MRGRFGFSFFRAKTLAGIRGGLFGFVLLALNIVPPGVGSYHTARYGTLLPP